MFSLSFCLFGYGCCSARGQCQVCVPRLEVKLSASKNVFKWFVCVCALLVENQPSYACRCRDTAQERNHQHRSVRRDVREESFLFDFVFVNYFPLLSFVRYVYHSSCCFFIFFLFDSWSIWYMLDARALRIGEHVFQRYCRMKWCACALHSSHRRWFYVVCFGLWTLCKRCKRLQTRDKRSFLIYHNDTVIWLSATVSVSHLINASTQFFAFFFLIFKFSKYAVGKASIAASSNTSNFLCPQFLHNKQCMYRFTISSWIFGAQPPLE